jgi:hypothetical protein
VSVVIVSPQWTCCAAFALPRVREPLDLAVEVLLNATKPAEAKTRIATSERRVGAVRGDRIHFRI